MYQERFEMVFRVAQKMTSSLDIGQILETIRNEAMTSIPTLREVCLVVMDQDVQNHFAPAQRAEVPEDARCQLCKTGWPDVPKEGALHKLTTCCDASEGYLTLSTRRAGRQGPTEAVLPIYDGEEPVAFLDAIAKEGTRLEERDMVLLKDLTDLAVNTIINARRHFRLAREKSALNRIVEGLRPFVPSAVQKMVQQNPDKPFTQKQDQDVSILFLDVEGYTLISDRLPRDDLNFLMETYFSAFLDEIYACGGDINETAGDGLMVIFNGTPDENAANAVRAAQNIHRKTLEINKELGIQFKPIVINMGINSGIASVGLTRFEGVTGTRMTFTATGPTTNLAARIAGAARNGEILVGAETAHRLGNGFAVSDMGFMTFKNMKEPVRVFSLDISCESAVYLSDNVGAGNRTNHAHCLS